MIRVFRKYQKTVGGILMLVVGALVISSFGIDLSNQGQRDELQRAALVNKEAISISEFRRRVRQVESQYRQMFGAQYDMFVKQMNLDVPQNVLDGLIDSTLLVQKLNSEGYAASDEQVKESILQQFPGGYSPGLLQSSGITPAEFLKDTENSIKSQTVNGIISDAAIPTKKEIEQAYIKQESTYKTIITTIDPKNFESKVQTPIDEQLESYYKDNQENYRTKPKASFKYASFKPSNFLNEIDIPSDEIDFYYTDNQKEFSEPEALNIQHIQFLFPKESDPKKLAEVKDKAKEALEKAKSGEDFSKLVTKYSDDYSSKSSNGNLGWVPKGRYSAQFDEKSYAVKNGGIADLIETDYGFHVVKVLGHKESTVKPLEEVKEKIISKLKNEQAPAIANAKATENFDKFLSTEGTLNTVVTKDQIKDSGLIEDGAFMKLKDPELAEISKKVFASLPEIKQLVDLKSGTYIVEVTEQIESQIPSLSLVKDTVIKDYKVSESQKLAKQTADKVLDLIKAGKTLLEASNAQNIQSKTIESLKTSSDEEILSNEEAKKALFDSSEFPTKVTNAYLVNGKYVLASVLSQTKPDITKAKPEELKKIKDGLKTEIANTVEKEFINSLKQKAIIETNPSVFNEL